MGPDHTPRLILTAPARPPALAAPPAATALCSALRGMPDLERSLARAAHRTAAPAQVLSLLRTLSSLPAMLSAPEDAAAAAAAGEAGWPGVRSALLASTLRQVADPGAAGAALRLLRQLDEDAAAANETECLFR